MLTDQDIFNRYQTKQIEFEKRANVTLMGHSLFDMWEGFEKTLTLKGQSVANLGLSGTSTRQYLDVIAKPQHIQHLGKTVFIFFGRKRHRERAWLFASTSTRLDFANNPRNTTACRV